MLAYQPAFRASDRGRIENQSYMRRQAKVAGMGNALSVEQYDVGIGL